MNSFLMIAAGVAAGNILTLSAFYGIKELMNHQSGETAPWWALGAVIFPMLIIALTVASIPA